MGIKESALSVIASLTDSDFIRAVTAAGESRKIQATGVGKYAVETYSGSTLAGSAQSVQSAVGGLKNDVTTMQGDISTLNTNLINKLKKSLIVGTASGSVASFNNGSDIFPALKCVAKIEPNQDLHGYDKPWFGGAGKNKLPQLKDGTYSGNGVTAVVSNGIATFSGTTTTSGNAIIIPLDEEFTVPSEVCYIHNLNSEVMATVAPSFELSTDISNTSVAFSFTSANRIAEIPSNRRGVKWDRVRFWISSGVTLSGTFSPMVCLTNTATTWQPYSNICPISGWSGVDVGRCGINFWDEVAEVGGLNVSTGATTVANRTRSKNYIPCVPNTSYYWKLPSSSGLAVCYYDASKTFVSGAWIFENQAHTTPANAYFMKFCTGDAYGTTYNNDISINYPSTDHDYHAYNGTTISVQFKDENDNVLTVYGGRDEIIGGELTVDRVSVTIDGNTAIQTNGAVGSVSKFFYYAPNKAFGTSNMISDKFTVGNTPLVGEMWGRSGNNGVEFNLPASVPQTVADGQAWFANNPTQLVYLLATPITYTLTPQQVDILLGDNNIFANTGPMDPVEYYADATITIQNLS